jgi:hypothetical protein
MLRNLLGGARGVGWKTLRAAGPSVEETEDVVEGEEVTPAPPMCEAEDATIYIYMIDVGRLVEWCLPTGCLKLLKGLCRVNLWLRHSQILQDG